MATRATAVLPCPIDDLPLSALTFEVLEGTDVERDAAKHIHVAVTGRVGCLNGHTWQASGNFMLERVS